ncbi:MAG: hypothetical protein ISQ23_04610 [Alphaproteobacteria bacterium]|nr:hypothetical protein [Alphaproteobacteria bacterium]MBL6776775.1 hypothetical protein [Alphaproteobacteria bacterium]
MATQTQENQEIEQAIERLSQKMRTVSDAMELARTPVKKKPANQNKASKRKKYRFSVVSIFKNLLLLLLFSGLSYMLASLVAVYIEKVKSQNNTETTALTEPVVAPNTSSEINTSEGTSEADRPAFLAPTIADTDLNPAILPKAPPIAPAPPVMADFALKEANYQLVDTELGRALDIFITVVNRGGGVGRPRLFEIELINKQNQQLMAWPMAVAGDEVPGNSEKVYKTRLLEPPADFHNIRVSMQK